MYAEERIIHALIAAGTTLTQDGCRTAGFDLTELLKLLEDYQRHDR